MSGESVFDPGLIFFFAACLLSQGLEVEFTHVWAWFCYGISLPSYTAIYFYFRLAEVLAPGSVGVDIE